jgi:hypothetical protein
MKCFVPVYWNTDTTKYCVLEMIFIEYQYLGPYIYFATETVHYNVLSETGVHVPCTCALNIHKKLIFTHSTNECTCK